MKTEITLTDDEIWLANLIAGLRYRSNRGSAVANHRIGKQSDEETDLEGFCAELAFCKLFNCYPDLNVFARKGGFDVIAKNGKRIDVKCTRYPHGRLLAPTNKTLGDADFYALMVGQCPTYRFAGYALASELINDGAICDMGYGPTYGLPQERLRQLNKAALEK